jgi:chromatin segregation and condensation protein Rec8/ScpA/Scc1 (kleisin family)
LGSPRLTTMVKGETIMPVPGGEITSTETWTENLIKQVEENPQMAEALADADALEEAIKTADAEPATEEFTLDEEVVEE